jgi:hypothetical protein
VEELYFGQVRLIPPPLLPSRAGDLRDSRSRMMRFPQPKSRDAQASSSSSLPFPFSSLPLLSYRFARPQWMVYTTGRPSRGWSVSCSSSCSRFGSPAVGRRHDRQQGLRFWHEGHHPRRPGHDARRLRWIAEEGCCRRWWYGEHVERTVSLFLFRSSAQGWPRDINKDHSALKSLRRISGGAC